MALTFLASAWYPPLEVLSKILLGGFVGGFTNSVAIKMLFEKKWYLPGSGVLFENRDAIIESLALTAEKHLLDVEHMEDWLREEVRKMNLAETKKVLNSFLEDFREQMLRFVHSPRAHRRVKEMLKSVARKSSVGLPAKLFILVGFRESKLDELADDILLEVGVQVSEFEVSYPMLQSIVQHTGTLEDFLFTPQNTLLRKNYDFSGSFMSFFFAKLRVREIVADKLSRYTPEEVTDIVSRNIRQHLPWLEFFGIVLGCLFVGIFELLHGPLGGIMERLASLLP